MPSDNDNVSRSAAKELIKKERLDCIEAGAIGAANTCGALLAALDSLPAAEADGRKLLDPEEVKAVLSTTLASHPMCRVWAEAAINAMAGIHVGDAPSPPAAEGAEREVNAALNKPFHKAECECAMCLEWHRDNPPVTIRRDGYFTCPKCTSPYFSRNPDTGMTKCNGSSSGPIVFGDSRGMCDWLGVWPPDFKPDNDISNSGPAAQLRGEG